MPYYYDAERREMCSHAGAWERAYPPVIAYKIFIRICLLQIAYRSEAPVCHRQGDPVPTGLSTFDLQLELFSRQNMENNCDFAVPNFKTK